MEKIIFKVSDQPYGISEGFIGAGMIIGAILATAVSKKLPFTKMNHYFNMLAILVFLMGVCPLPFIMASSGPSYLSYIIFTGSGFLFAGLLAIVSILCMTYLQTEISIDHMGKSMALTLAMSNALYPVGQVIFGNLYDVCSSSTWIVYVFVGVCTLLIAYIIRKLIHKNFPETIKTCQ